MTRPTLSRRTLLQYLAYGAAGSAVAACTPRDAGVVGNPTAETASGLVSSPTTAGRVSPARRVRPDQPILVLIEQGGGLDALSTLVPVGHARYQTGRGSIAHGADEVVTLEQFGDRGLHPGLAPLADRGLAIVEGVGLEQHVGSHFAAGRHWYRGDRRGDWGEQTGILGRLSDELSVGQPFAGLSVSNGSPIMADRTGSTRSLPSTGHFDWMADPRGADRVLVDQLGAIGAAAGADGGLDIARRGLAQMSAFSDVVRRLAPPSADYQIGSGARDLGDRLALVSRLIRSDLGIRVFHVPHGGYDTHTTHRFAPPNDWSPDHDQLLGDYGTNVARFLDDMAEHGLADRVVVASFSEFGRRVDANHSGTDHGWATSMLLSGPVNPGLHGADPGLGALVDGNQPPTVLLDAYLGALAEGWLGVPMSTVLPRFGATPLGGLFA